MGNSRVARKIKMATVDDLLGVPAEYAEAVLIEVDRIQQFKDNQFKVLDDSKMEDLVDSIKVNGVLNPVILRANDGSQYEMISGHRRLHASKLAGLDKIPAISKQMSDVEATIIMVDSNIQREELLPSEKAFALRMKMEAVSRQGARTDLTSGPEVQKLNSNSIGDKYGMKSRQVRRYIRLTYLLDELIDYVDKGRIGINIAVQISYFDKTVQEWIYQYVRDNGFIKTCQIDALKNYPAREINGHSTFIDVMIGALTNINDDRVVLSMKKLDKFFSSNTTKDMRVNTILKLLSDWYESEDDISIKAERR